MLQLLLTLPRAALVPEQMPPIQAFRSQELRLLYGALLSILEAEAGQEVSGDETLEVKVAAQLRLDENLAPAIDRFAGLLLEKSTRSPENEAPVDELQNGLKRLSHRYMRERQKQVTHAMQEAQRKGDQQALEALLTEQSELSRLLHQN